MNWKPITMAEAVALTNAGESTVYMLTPMTDFTFVKALADADGFVLVEEETDPEDDERFPAEPEQWTESDNEEDEEPDEEAEETAEDPEEEDETEDEPAENEDELEEPSTRQKARHQSIINMYMAGRSIRYIAQEFEINPAAVKYHLHKEGLV